MRLLAFRILDQKAALRALHEHDEHDERDHHGGNCDDKGHVHRGRTRLRDQVEDGFRHLRDNPGENDQRNAIADTACGNLLTHPHQQHGAAGQRHNAGQDEERRGNAVNTHRSQAAGNRKGLHQGKAQRQIACVLVDLLASGLPFFLQLFKRRRGGRQHLDDDGRRDVGHHVEREDPHPLNGATGKHVHGAQHAVGLAFEQAGILGGVEARNRNEGTESIQEQDAEGEEDPRLQVLGLRKARKIHIPSHLFSSICHWPLDLPEKAFAA